LQKLGFNYESSTENPEEIQLKKHMRSYLKMRQELAAKLLFHLEEQVNEVGYKIGQLKSGQFSKPVSIKFPK